MRLFNPETAIPKGFQVLSWVAPKLAGRLANRLFLTPQRIPRPEWEKKIWNTGKQIRFPSGRIARHFGPSSGPLLVFIHGWEGRGSQFGYFFQPALERGFQVLAWDGPAHGDSPGKKTNMVEFSRALIEDLKSFNHPVHTVLGHSFGGGTCILAHHLGLECQRIVLIAAPASTQAIFKRFTQWIRLTPKGIDYFRKDVEGEAGMSIDQLELMELAKNYSIPGLIVHDVGDKDVPFQESLDMHQAWKNSRHLKTTGLGHRKLLKSPETISSILDFVAGH